MKNIKLILFVLILICSCTTKKKILYTQDLDNNYNIEFSYIEYQIDIDDILKITIDVQSVESPLNDKNLNNYNSSKDALLFSGFQVDPSGNISIAQIGQIMVKGMTISELENFITSKIKEKGILIDPNVDVKLLNATFTVLGEVNRPGKYDFLKNNMNLLEAIGMAGDLTINGSRKKITLIRDNNNKLVTAKLDLTNSKFLQSDYFQIFPGDIIIVDPNTSRVKNAGIIGNSGTLLSLLSFILSSIIVINS